MRRATGYDNRAGDPDRPGKTGREPSHKESMTSVAGEAGVFFENYQGETRKEHGIPRKSLSARQNLEFEEMVEFEKMKPTRRLQQATGLVPGKPKAPVMVETTDERFRLTFKREKTLLRKGRPDNFGEGRGTTFKRETAHTKEIVPQIEIKEAPPTCECGHGRHEHKQDGRFFTACTVIENRLVRNGVVIEEGTPCKCTYYTPLHGGKITARPAESMLDDI